MNHYDMSKLLRILLLSLSTCENDRFFIYFNFNFFVYFFIFILLNTVITVKGENVDGLHSFVVCVTVYNK
jgi:hypothetical protein